MRKKLICMALTTAALSAAILAGCGKQGEKTENTAPSGTVQSDNLPVNENGEPDPLGIYQEPVKLKIAQVVNPVSYTHLDVYKRQSQRQVDFHVYEPTH